MRIGCCQFQPSFKKPLDSIKHVNQLLKNILPGSLDLLLLPEMSFTGYQFQSADEILPFVEDEETGLSVTWAKEKAIALQTMIVIGYPRKDKIDPHTFYNSVSLISSLGKTLHVYDKHFLFTTDEHWAKEGSGFSSFSLEPLGTVGLGICMDINPKRFQSSFTDYEFANFHLKSDWLLLSMAWLKSENFSMKNLLNYWIQRLEPLIDASVKKMSPTTIVICNRVGEEQGKSVFSIISFIH
jgi:protein N-terminal amidase